MTEQLKLYGYWRSSAAYRVRIALNLKGLDYEDVPVDLIRDGGDQLRPGYETTHPQRLIPVLQHGHRMIRQSLAIIEYIDEIWSSPPLLPIEPRDRAHTRALALLVACDIHPLNNLRVMRYLEREFDVQQPARDAWMRHWIEDGFRAFEAMLVDDLARGTFCEGDTPGLADCCLIPQIYNARRFKVDMTPYPTIRAIEAECMALPAFDAARPENQPDAPSS
ncbi:MAG: maleylacetoacetate isomerase [Lysobacter sp.]|nr:maleylacetoacetate isomerase [Lysobacter sp.]